MDLKNPQNASGVFGNLGTSLTLNCVEIKSPWFRRGEEIDPSTKVQVLLDHIRAEKKWSDGDDVTAWKVGRYGVRRSLSQEILFASWFILSQPTKIIEPRSGS